MGLRGDVDSALYVERSSGAFFLVLGMALMMAGLEDYASWWVQVVAVVFVVFGILLCRDENRTAQERERR